MLDLGSLETLRREVAGFQQAMLDRMNSHQLEAYAGSYLLPDAERVSNAFANASYVDELSQVLGSGSSSTPLDQAQLAVLEGMRYLAWYEGPFQTLLTALCGVAVCTGRKFVIRRHNLRLRLTSPEQIGIEAYVKEKVRFLRDLDLSVLESLVDPDLRNSLAHMEYHINSDGTIEYTVVEKSDNGKAYVRERMGGVDLGVLSRNLRAVCEAMLRGIGDVNSQVNPDAASLWEVP